MMMRMDSGGKNWNPDPPCASVTVRTEPELEGAVPVVEGTVLRATQLDCLGPEGQVVTSRQVRRNPIITLPAQ